MKKNLYRTVSIKKVDEEKLLRSLDGGKRIVVGVDVAKTDFVAGLAKEDGEIDLTVKWEHPCETREFVELLKRMKQKLGIAFDVAMEPSGTYGDSLRYELGKEGFTVFLVSPKRSHDAAEVFDGVPSWHDAKSASIITQLHLAGRSKVWENELERERELKSKLNVMKMYDEQFHQDWNRLEATMARYWPEVMFLMGYDSVAFLSLLMTYGGPEGISAAGEEAKKYMKVIGGHFLSDEKVEQVIASTKGSLGVPMLKGEKEELQELAGDMLRAQRAAHEARCAVERLSESDPVTREVGKVVGKTTAAVIVTSVGDPTRYDSAEAFQKGMGLNLKEKSSGTHKGVLKITKRGPSAARQYMYLAVLRLIRTDEIIRAWYIKKVKRDGGKKGKALTAVMRKLAKALWHVAQGAVFDASKLFDVRRLDLERA